MLGDSERDEAARQDAAPTPVQNPSRRRFGRAGVAGGAVLGSLASQPVLGTTSKYWCTISGKLSGNVSNHANDLNCKTLGKSPGYWKNKTWPSPCVKGTLSNNWCNFSGSYVQGTIFNGYSSGGKTLLAAFKTMPNSGVCKIYDATDSSNFAACTKNATMLQVLETGGGLNDTAIASLGRATVASLLNARQFGGSFGSYPLTESQIIEMFNAVYLGGLYQINPSVAWNRDDVRNYFESLYGA
jgi:hypothetical protein